jgi:hypothetical protein
LPSENNVCAETLCLVSKPGIDRQKILKFLKIDRAILNADPLP